MEDQLKHIVIAASGTVAFIVFCVLAGWRYLLQAVRQAQAKVSPKEREKDSSLPGDVSQEDVGRLLQKHSHMFLTILNGAPMVPRPLPSGYKHISLRGLQEQAEEIAPVQPVTSATPVHVRQLQQLRLLHSKAAEYAHLHRRLSSSATLAQKTISALSTMASLALATLLRVFPGSKTVTLLSGITATLISTAGSWVKFADYEAKADMHDRTSDAFADEAVHLHDLFVAMSAEEGEQVRCVPGSFFCLRALSYLRHAQYTLHCACCSDQC